MSLGLGAFGTSSAFDGTIGRSGTLTGRTLSAGGSFLASAAFGIKTLSDKENDLKAREQQELTNYQVMLETEKARETLAAMFPNLTRTQIAAKVEQVKKTKPGSEERWRLIFSHDPALLNMVDASQAFDDYMMEIVKRQTTSRKTFSGLRSKDELPNNVEAYFTSLREDLESLSLAMDIDGDLYRSDKGYNAVIDYLNMNNYRTQVVYGFDKKTDPFFKELQ